MQSITIGQCSCEEEQTHWQCWTQYREIIDKIYLFCTPLKKIFFLIYTLPLQAAGFNCGPVTAACEDDHRDGPDLPEDPALTIPPAPLPADFHVPTKINL